MLLDSARFIESERPHWEELEKRLEALEANLPAARDPQFILGLHNLYRRTASGLARLEAGAGDPAVIHRLEALVARAYAEIHAGRARRRLWRRGWDALATGFPRAFRRRFRAFAAVLWIVLAGGITGAVAMAADRDNRTILFPFPHLHGAPSERVAAEESGDGKATGAEARFAASLMQNNIRVSVLALALGITYGIGTVVVVFYNSVILGGVGLDYITDGQGVFLFAWLLPHGSVELPAIFIGGQGGLVLARALIGGGRRGGMRIRLREVAADLSHLALGLAVLLVWAGIVEAFFSQLHEPAVPYAVKITFGVVQLAALAAWLRYAGRGKEEPA